MSNDRVLRVVSVNPRHPSRQEKGWEERSSTVHISIDLGLKSEKLGIIELPETEALDLIENLVVATGHVRKANR